MYRPFLFRRSLANFGLVSPSSSFSSSSLRCSLFSSSVPFPFKFSLSSFSSSSSSSSLSSSSSSSPFRGLCFPPHDSVRQPNLNLKRTKNALHRRNNIVVMGAPGSGKSSVCRVLARLLNRPLIDVDDDVLEPAFRMTVAEKLKQTGDAEFLKAEANATMAINANNSIISLTGSNPLHPETMEHIAQNSTIFYLDIEKSDILSRMSHMKVDRIVGQSSHSLSSILDYRARIYENSYDHRIIVPSSSSSSSSPLSELSAAKSTASETSPESIAQQILDKWRQEQAFVSTRGQEAAPNGSPLEFLDVVRQGLSDDRGLFVAKSMIPFTNGQLARLQNLSYPELALRVIERFPLGSLSPSTLRSLLYSAYSHFSSPSVLPVRRLHGHHHLLETYYGPTASFKDLSLQLLPGLMHEANKANKGRTNEQERVGLLVATSGDTGTAALDGFSRNPNSGPVIVLYPADGVSAVQKAQMLTAKGSVLVIGVDADFDFCQTTVKDILNTPSLLSSITSLVPGLSLSSANSINWGRFVPQVVFTFAGYLQLLSGGAINKIGDPVDVVVPTGNFGNILGAVYARKLGLPIRKLVSASNDNNVLHDFIQTGKYDLRNRKFKQTVSPSIDILVSSNLERFLHLLSSGDVSVIRSLFSSLSTSNMMSLVDDAHHAHLFDAVRSCVSSQWCSEEECLQTIRRVHKDTKNMIDPHTAVAKFAADQFSPVHANEHTSSSGNSTVPVLISSTAHFAKFPEAMLHAIRPNLYAAPSQVQSLSKPSSSSSSEQLQSHISSQFSALSGLSEGVNFNSIHPELKKLATADMKKEVRAKGSRDEIVKIIQQWLKEYSANH